MGVVLARNPGLPLLLGLSLALHAAALGAALHGRPGPPAIAFEATSAVALVGETLDVTPPAEDVEVAPMSPSPPAAGERAAVALPLEAPSRRDGPTRAARAGSSAGGSPPSSPALFGAVGVRYATDLATTFTRGFPQAASADAIWATAPLGPAGTAEVTLVLDDGGHLSSSTVNGSPSPALRRGVDRTLGLLASRTFTARGAVTRLLVTARVTGNDVPDGLHGDVFALSGGSFAGSVGTAFFALPSSSGAGRRIDVELRLMP